MSMSTPHPGPAWMATRIDGAIQVWIHRKPKRSRRRATALFPGERLVFMTGGRS